MQLAADLVVANRFRLNRLLGRGGMGSVWHATHLGLDTPCAVKFIEGEHASHPEAQARFEREAKAAAQLRSPHVVQIMDHGVWEGVPYIAMELLDGEDLGKRFSSVGRMNPKELIVIVTQVCRALTKAHAMGVVHRDLKPDNIFLVRDDDREIAKVLDFGIAKKNDQALEGGTKTGAMLGTPYYMSPEQAQGTKAVDFRSDLWSLAVIVYQGLTARLPFESEALGDLLVKIIVSPLPVPSEEVQGLPPAFDRWWAKASCRDPNGRFQSAKEFVDALEVVFGVSQMTEMVDRTELRSQIAAHEAAPGRTVALSAHASSSPAVLPPGMAGMGIAPGAPVEPTTGSPLSRTFTQDAPIPKKRTGLVVGLSLAAVFLLGSVGAAGVFLKSRGAVAAAAPPPVVEPQKNVEPKPADPPPTLAPPESAASAQAPSATPEKAAPAEKTTATEKTSAVKSTSKPPLGGTSNPGKVQPRPTPKPRDLGF